MRGSGTACHPVYRPFPELLNWASPPAEPEVSLNDYETTPLPSINHPTPDPSQEGSRRSSALVEFLLGGVRGGFMVPMRAKNGVEAFE